jgi:hypothetical protein
MLKRAIGILPPRDFTFLPTFFSLAEQRILLATALRKLDAMESIQSRRRRKALLHVGHLPTLHPTTSNPVQDCFLPEDCYEFEEVLTSDSVSFSSVDVDFNRDIMME